MRRMSFALTKQQFLDGTKTVTRRKGWRNVRAGERLLAVEKCMGLRKGESQVVLGPFEVLMSTYEELSIVTPADVVREGFPDMTPTEFVAMFCRHMGGKPSQMLTRIEFKRLACDRRACQAVLGDAHYRIWNDPATGEPRLYCVPCGRRIIEGNAHDEVKLRFKVEGGAHA